MKSNLKKTWVVAFGLASTLILAGCMNKTAPIGDFNSAIETYSAQTKAQFLDFANQSLKLAEQTTKTNQGLNLEFEHNKVGHGNFSLTTDSVVDKEKNFKTNAQVELNLKTKDKVELEVLKEANSINVNANADLNVLIKDKNLFMQLMKLDVDAKGKNANISLIKSQVELFKHQLKDYLNQWIKIDGNEGNVLVDTIHSALAQKDISQAAEVVDALTNFTNFSYLKQDGNETKYKGQPAYKLKLDEEQFYKELSDDINALKAVVEKSNPLVIEDKEVEDKITPETLKEKIKIKEVKAYLVKFKNDEYRLAISKLILEVEGEAVEISNIPSEDKNTYTIKTKEVTITMNVLDRKQEGLEFDGKVVSEDIAFNILGSLVNETTDTSAKINFIIKFGLEKFVPFKEVEGLNIALTNTSTQEVSNEEVSAPVQYKLLSEIEQAQKKTE